MGESLSVMMAPASSVAMDIGNKKTTQASFIYQMLRMIYHSGTVYIFTM
jgi:hypothetical protein